MTNTITQKTIDTVARIIDELTNNEELFTAYDITSILRARNLSDGLTHWQIKDVVHDYYLTGNMSDDYVRTNTFFSGNPALLYLPSNKNVSDYDPDKFKLSNALANSLSKTVFGGQGADSITSSITSTVSPINSNYPPIVPKATNPLKHSLPPKTPVQPDEFIADSRGRITIRKNFVDAISNHAGWLNVNKSSDMSQILFYKGNLWNVDAYSVDRYRNVKVSLGKNKAGSKYKVTRFDDELVITEVN